ncbi:MAG: 4Fe-4S dicluster domain-containing protein [Planctomycetes bacterium]|nr:4Fe-4S dicluster domain-containing protein [Planctomycetota bacterium]
MERAENSAPPPRRRFFTAGLRALLEGAETMSRSVRDRLPLAAGLLLRRPSAPTNAAAPPLRPPGALPEAEFVATCERSGHCVAACPVQALVALRSADPRRDGTPQLIPSQRACVLCDDLSCMKACPSGALSLVPRAAIRIGLAVVHHDDCRRSVGEPCRECIDRCPLQAEAISLDAQGRVAVRADGCTGCGVCELYCPTAPRAITVLPLAQRPAPDHGSSP